MNNRNIALIIDTMFLGCSDEQKTKLAALYKDAYTNTTEFKDMKFLLENYDFYGSVGSDLYNQGTAALKEGVTQAGKFSESISIIEYVIANSRKLADETTDYIYHAEHSNKNLFIIEKQQGKELKEFLLELFNTICYTVAVLYDVKYLKDVRIDLNGNALDLLKMVTNELSNILQELLNAPKPYAWRLYRKDFKGANIVHYRGFIFEKIELNYADALVKYNKVSPYIFEPKEPSDTLCYGFGSLSNLKITEGARVISASNIITKLAENSLEQLELDYYNLDISALLSAINSNNIFVVKADDVCELLNRFFMMKNVKERNTKQICPYCGKNGCNHFNIPRNFGN